MTDGEPHRSPDSSADADESVVGRVARRLTPGVIRRNYRAKFVISILLVVVVLGAVGGVNYVSAEATVEEDAEQQLTSMVDMHGDSINEWAVSMETHTRSVSSVQALSGADAGTAEEELIQKQAQLPVDVRAVHLVDTADETVVTSTSPDLRGDSVDEVTAPWSDVEPGVDLTSSNDVWNSPTAYESSAMGDQVMAFASPVAGDESRVVVVVGTLEYRVDNLRQLHADQETTIIGADGEAILSSDAGAVDADLDVVGELGAARDGTAFDRGDDEVVAYASTGDKEWVAVTTVPTAQAFAASDAVGTSVLTVIGAGLLSLMVVGFALNRQTVGPLRDLRDRAERMESGDLSVGLETPRVDEIGRLYGSFGAMRDSLSTKIEEAETAQEAAETERERMARRNDRLQSTADDYGETMRDAAEGDLTVRMRTDADDEAMAAIAEEFNEMIAEIERTYAQLTTFADEVASASERATESTEAVAETASEVAGSVDEISRGAADQSESLTEVSDEMSDLSATIEEVASSSDQVADAAARTAEAGNRGQEAAKDAIAGMEATEETVEEAVAAIHALDDEVSEVDQLIDRITEIAEQTNILALNANIEAARSEGEAGKGFEVVAEEIKALSDEVKDAAETAESRIDAIRERMDQSTAEVESTSEQIDDAAERVAAAVDDLEHIAELADETNDGVQEISDVTEEQAASTEEVVAMADEVATISEETASEADTVAAAAEEQTTSLTDVSESVSSLSERATRLSATLDRFETDADLDPAADTNGTGADSGSRAAADGGTTGTE
ncbi:methyl-accepting chemotaxis protein [Halorubrum alkaliphilum]|uniref:Methyl-accepting chemotaxis protein n=1 Tax=Halorubrum alkaliphilum TaxID=261290 RepID=A0A8T4GBF1_9EURY|nr:methyl-accepting chemotaxis protein [Halorubrum alkaliphilum]MBP1921059.1 methyl-accepting chemotaxis protein [Halorubrum alkaliphilum]